MDKVLAENLIYFVRDTEEEEDKQIEKLNIKTTRLMKCV
jgi:arginase